MPRQIPSSIPLQPPPSKLCEHSDVCGRDVLEGHDGRCILHSTDSEKDVEAFKRALKEHREEHGPNFGRMVFPGGVFFMNLSSAMDSTFEERASFHNATFEEDMSFGGATFKAGASFGGTKFKGDAYFDAAKFEGGAYFSDTIFGDEVSFTLTRFEAGVSFLGTRWGEDLLFADTKVVFIDVRYDSDNPPEFRFVDLSRCRFARTDLRKIDFTGVQWCEKVSDWELFTRVGLYDEIAGEGRLKIPFTDVPSWHEVERLYRHLKKTMRTGGTSRGQETSTSEKRKPAAETQIPTGVCVYCSTSTVVLANTGSVPYQLPFGLWCWYLVVL